MTATPASSSRGKILSGCGPKTPMRPVSVAARHLFPFSGAARDAVFVAGKASRIGQLERAQRLLERLAHPGARLIDQDRADVDPLRRDHTAGGALEFFGLVLLQMAAPEGLPRLVGAQALLLRSDPEEGEDFQPRTRKTDSAHPLQELRPDPLVCLFAAAFRV